MGNSDHYLLISCCCWQCAESFVWSIKPPRLLNLIASMDKFVSEKDWITSSGMAINSTVM